MGKQIVICGNRILAYGENCFLSMGGTVICPDTSKVYQNATVAEVETLPSDIDSVGYEYHGGEFVPCAPFGKGTGNVAVFCNEDCKSLKDTGIPFSQMGEIVEFTYTGDGMANGITLPHTFHKKPKILFISGNEATGIVLITPGVGFSIANNLLVATAAGGSSHPITRPLTVVITETEDGFHVKLIDAFSTMNFSSKAYTVTAIC